MDVLAKLGIDGKLLFAQAVNFGILFFLLRRFAYRPILEFLDERAARIEKGLSDAEAANVKLVEMEAKEKVVLATARAQARELIGNAEEVAKKRGVELYAEAEEKVKKFLEEAQVKIEEERRKALAEAKQEIAETVVLAVEKMLRKKVDAETDKALIGKTMK